MVQAYEPFVLSNVFLLFGMNCKPSATRLGPDRDAVHFLNGWIWMAL